MTPPAITGVCDGCDVEVCDVEDGFQANEVDDLIDADEVVGVVLLRRGIDDSVSNDGLYVM